MNSRKWNRDIDAWTFFRASLVKKTRPREAMLYIFQKASKPLSATEIYEKNPRLSLPTIYRTLILFEKMRLIHKTHTENDSIYYEI